MSTLETLRQQLDALVADIAATQTAAEDAAEARVTQMAADCAAAMEQAAAAADRRLAAERTRLLAEGRQEGLRAGMEAERCRALRLIEQVSGDLVSGGSNARALQTLRGLVEGGS